MSTKSSFNIGHQRVDDLISSRRPHHHHQIVSDLCYWSAECQDTSPDSFQKDLSLLCDDESTISDSQQSSTVHGNIKTAISSSVAAMLDSTMTSEHACDNDQTTRPSHKQTSGQAIEMTQSQKRIITKKLKRVGRMIRQGGHDELRTLALL